MIGKLGFRGNGIPMQEVEGPSLGVTLYRAVQKEWRVRAMNPTLECT